MRCLAAFSVSANAPPSRPPLPCYFDLFRLTAHRRRFWFLNLSQSGDRPDL